jgi:hypothetical protein
MDSPKTESTWSWRPRRAGKLAEVAAATRLQHNVHPGQFRSLRAARVPGLKRWECVCGLRRRVPDQRRTVPPITDTSRETYSPSSWLRRSALRAMPYYSSASRTNAGSDP